MTHGSNLASRLNDELAKRRDNRIFRALDPDAGGIDFCSNDYLGMASSPLLKDRIMNEWRRQEHLFYGSTGSPLLTGHHTLVDELSSSIAAFHHAEAGLIFSSGFAANVGLFSTVPSRHQIVIYDEYVHASIREGIRLGLAKSYSFAHNDLADLEKKLRSTKANGIVVVESIYSMEGIPTPLAAIADLCEEYHAELVVDEAHATGIFGPKGEGLVVAEKLEKSCFARIHTFGKAMGGHGAIVLGSATLKDYLINFCKPFIYSTSLPYTSILGMKCAYDILSEHKNTVRYISDLSKIFKSKLQQLPEKYEWGGVGPIFTITVPGNRAVLELSKHLQSSGFMVLPIRYPTVPKGKERIRICLHVYNATEEMDALIDAIREGLDRNDTSTENQT